MNISSCTVVLRYSGVPLYNDTFGSWLVSLQNKQSKEQIILFQVIKHKEFKSRLDFDMAVHAALEDADVELVCLAGFMRIVTAEFVRKWHGRLLNVHPSLLPSFKGMHAHKLVLEAGVCISGCTVHFVEVS